MSEISQFNCNDCNLVFDTQKALKNHLNKSKAHKDMSEFRTCEYCKKTLSSSYNLKRHLSICKSKIEYIKKELEEKERIDSLKIAEKIEEEKKKHQKALAEINNLKSKLEEEQQAKNQLTELSLKTIQNIANNTKNVTNNITIYNYIQPITHEFLADILKHRRTDMITNGNDLIDLFADKLKDKVFQTDSSRHVIMYKEGEEMKRDPHAKELSKKIFSVSAPELQPFKSLVEDKIKCLHSSTNLDDLMEQTNKLVFLDSLSNPKDSYITEFGKNLVQKLPTKEHFFRNLSSNTFFNLKIYIESKIYSSITLGQEVCEVFLGGCFRLGVLVKRMLEESKLIMINPKKPEEVLLKDDEGMWRKDIGCKILTEIVREILNENEPKMVEILANEQNRKIANLLNGFDILLNFMDLIKFRNGDNADKFLSGLTFM